jgi:hypothetical protein
MLATLGLGAAEAPRLLLARGEDGKVTLRFTPVAGAEHYELRRSDRDGTAIRSISVADYTAHGLRNGTRYRFAVRALVDGVASPESNELSAVPVEDPAWATLREAFASANPTRNSNPFTMVHGNETEAQLRQILRVAYEAGFEGVALHPYNYADYLGPGQWDRWRILLDEAQRLGLCIWQQDDRVTAAVAALALFATNVSYQGLGPHLAGLGIEDVVIPPCLDCSTAGGSATGRTSCFWPTRAPRPWPARCWSAGPLAPPSSGTP